MEIIIKTPTDGQFVRHNVEVIGRILEGFDRNAIIRTVTYPKHLSTYHPQSGIAIMDSNIKEFKIGTYIGNNAHGSDTNLEFIILIVLCNEYASNLFDDYLRTANEAGWPGLRILPKGVTIIKEINVIRNDTKYIDIIPEYENDSSNSTEKLIEVRGIKIPKGYGYLQDALQTFFSDKKHNCTDYEKNVFIIMKYDDKDDKLNLIYLLIEKKLKEYGYFAHRADDKKYSSNLFDNVSVYMIGCKYGIAILENIKLQHFNPNVALEYGFMRALNKELLLLKELNFELNADLLGQIWAAFDQNDIPNTIGNAINRWLNNL